MSESVDCSEQKQVFFRRVKKKPKTLRTKDSLDQADAALTSMVDSTNDKEEDRDGVISLKITDIQEAQLTRKRRHGMTALECALGKKLASEFDELEDDPFRMRGGGMMQLSENKKLQITAKDIESGIKEQFRKESLLRDEHAEMKKYIDERLNTASSKESYNNKAQSNSTDDFILLKAAEKVRGFKSKENEELLSNQMLVGIPEVDLGIDVRIRNVLETEQKLAELQEKANAKKSMSSDNL